jgi:ADP-dependent phosphofructokinase/glucokinase
VLNGVAGSDVVLGLGSCLDYEISWDATVLDDLVIEYGIAADEVGTEVVVDTERDLVRSILGFVADSVGGERFVASSSVLEMFAARFPRRITLGGTNVRAAVAMSRLGLRSTVHLVSIDDHVRTLLPEGVSTVCSAVRDSTAPHLIVQFPAGARVRVGDQVLQSARADRLIYANDLPNREMVLSPDLGTALTVARLFLVSGFNSMQDGETLDRRLAELREYMAALPGDAVVVYEDAGFHVPDLSRRVRGHLLDRVDVYGMDAAAVAAALPLLHGAVPAPVLVVHTGCWSLAYRPGDGIDAQVLREALECGTAVAGARYLHGDEFTAADVGALGPAERNVAGAAFAEALEALVPGQVVCVPSLALDTPAPTSVGLGDAFVGGLVAVLAASARA